MSRSSAAREFRRDSDDRRVQRNQHIDPALRLWSAFCSSSGRETRMLPRVCGRQEASAACRSAIMLCRESRCSHHASAVATPNISGDAERAAGVLPATNEERRSDAGGTLGPDLVFILQASRPGFWLTAIWFYLLPVAQRPVWNSFDFWLGVFFVSFPFGLLIYGWNDIM